MSSVVKNWRKAAAAGHRIGASDLRKDANCDRTEQLDPKVGVLRSVDSVVVVIALGLEEERVALAEDLSRDESSQRKSSGEVGDVSVDRMRVAGRRTGCPKPA
jgi:hypothetical protein